MPLINVSRCSLAYLLVVFIALIPGTLGDWKFKSRPDLSPPTPNITVRPSSEVSPGYIFVAPYSDANTPSSKPQGPSQAGPYIFTTTGELIWSGFGYFGGFTANFQAAKFKGKDVLFAFEGTRHIHKGHGHGHIKILDSHYETIKEVRAGNHRLISLHEFHIVDEKTALVEIYQPKPYELRKFGVGPKSQWIVDAKFQEIDIETGELVFEWSSLDHVLPDESSPKISSLLFGTGHNSSDPIDYFHLNSVERDDKHNYLISGRHTSTIYKVNRTSGEILWRLGGKQSNFSLGKGVNFSFQHHARFLSQSEGKNEEIISLFNNGDDPSSISSGKIISLNTKTWTATLVQDFPAPDSIFAFSQGNTQILPNGNAFVNWGSAGAITEFSPNGSVIFHAYLDSGDLWKNSDIQNYRGFKFNWTGLPHEEPAIVALKHGESTMLYVSWNGDTETKVWRFYGIDKKGRSILIGEEERTGFETGIYVKSGGDWSSFFAEAVDGNGAKGKVLRKTGTAVVEPYIYEYVPGRDDFAQFETGQTILGRE